MKEKLIKILTNLIITQIIKKIHMKQLLMNLLRRTAENELRQMFNRNLNQTEKDDLKKITQRLAKDSKPNSVGQQILKSIINAL